MSAPATLHLLRHGEPALTGRLLGRTDCAATEAGIAACVRQAADLDVTAIVTSDLARAVACADAIGGSRGLPVRVDPSWRELDFGDWDGLAAADIDPSALGRFWADPDGRAPPGGERWSALVARVAAALAEVGDGGLVVTHGGAMRAALAALCGFSVAQTWAFDLPCAALLTLRVWPGPPRAAQIAALLA